MDFLVIEEKILFSFFLREFDVCKLLNLILKEAFASAGITLSAVLSMLIFVTSRLDGSKSLLPPSSFNFLILFKTSTIIVEGLL